MSEHMEPIPSRIYNAAVGGHVAGADQIIDDETGLTLDKVTGGALEEKTYTSGSNNGMGRVVLRKNLVNGVNTLTQTMINKSNTIYVIQYDFTLGEDITVPANCVLEFDGGSISGAHTLTGNNTGIQAGLIKIFDTDVIFAGSWNVAEAYPEWFGAKGDGVTDDTLAIQKTFDAGFGNIYINPGTYMIEGWNVNSTGSCQPYFKGVRIKSNTNLELHPDAILKVISDGFENNNQYTYVCIDVLNVENVTIKGGKILGFRTGETGEWGYGINITNSKNVVIEDVKVYDCLGDGISFNGRNNSASINHSQNCIVRNCEVYNCRRLALAIAGVDGLLVDNCKLMNTHGAEPQSAIDIELDVLPGVNDNIEIKNCIMRDNARGFEWGQGGLEGQHINKVSVHDCELDGLRFSRFKINNLRFFNNTIIGGCSFSDIEVQESEYELVNCIFRNFSGGGSIKSLKFKDCTIYQTGIFNINSYGNANIGFYNCIINANVTDNDDVCISSKNEMVVENCDIEADGTLYGILQGYPLIVKNSSIKYNGNYGQYAVALRHISEFINSSFIGKATQPLIYIRNNAKFLDSFIESTNDSELAYALSSNNASAASVINTKFKNFTSGYFSDKVTINNQSIIIYPLLSDTVPAAITDLNKIGFGIGICNTAASQASKTVSISNFTLKKNSIISVRFVNGITVSTFYLNINNTGDKIIRMGGNRLPPQVIRAGVTAILLYDGTYYNVISLLGYEQSINDLSNVVDLGLPSGTLWSKSNIDISQDNKLAPSREVAGSYFSFGNTFGINPIDNSFVNVYDWGTAASGVPYKDTEGAKITSDIPAQIDAARANLGSPWRLPTKEQFTELIDNCTASWTQENGVNGWLFTASNGNSIFFPVCGYGYSTSLYNGTTNGYYMTKNINVDSPGTKINIFSFTDSGKTITSNFDKYSGICIRPVI